MGGSHVSRSGSVGSSDPEADQQRLRLLEPVALRAVCPAAVAAGEWTGRGDGPAADAAATNAMRAALEQEESVGTVVTGEGEKDDAPMLEPDEQLGGDGPAYDIAVDPLECTSLCAAGMPGALTTISMAARGAMRSPGPAFYMDKLVVGPAARDVLDFERGPIENARRIAEALDVPLSELRVVVLDKPRHADLVRDLRAAGARVMTPSAGDVAGALAAVLEDGVADVLMGIGGTPEGIMTACAVRALGGGMQARLAPQLEDEAAALAAADVDLDAILELDDLISGPALFAAAGVTGGDLLPAPEAHPDGLLVHTLVVTAGEARRAVTTLPRPTAREN
ncbi:MAG: fructose-bisphosphatase class II family protein [Actinomycetota bacterium]|nr:fructose-bisphosphatase class II family protein [Actinomycetota bacterium]